MSSTYGSAFSGRAIVGTVAALLLVVALRDPGARRVARIVEVGALVAMVGAWLAWIADFLGSAGRELQNLVEDLRHCAMPYTCPHGRPTLIEMNFRELEKKFGRTQ